MVQARVLTAAMVARGWPRISTTTITPAATAVSASSSSPVNSCAATSRPSQSPASSARPRPVRMPSSASMISGGSTANWRWKWPMPAASRAGENPYTAPPRPAASRPASQRRRTQNRLAAEPGEAGRQQDGQAGLRAGQQRHRSQQHPGEQDRRVPHQVDALRRVQAGGDQGREPAVRDRRGAVAHEPGEQVGVAGVARHHPSRGIGPQPPGQREGSQQVQAHDQPGSPARDAAAGYGRGRSRLVRQGLAVLARDAAHSALA